MKIIVHENAFEAEPGKQVTWRIAAPETLARVENRQPLRWRLKINPVWWFQNLAEPDPPEWYKPDAARWWRYVGWYLRNPLQNFGRYVVGVCDRNYLVVGTAPVLGTTTFEEFGKPGWKWSIIRLKWLRLPYISFENDKIIFYAGWQHWGFFGFKFNVKNIASWW